MDDLADSSDNTACLLLGLSAAQPSVPEVETVTPGAAPIQPAAAAASSAAARGSEATNVGDRRSQVAALPRKEWN